MEQRVIKFRAFADLRKLKIMIDEVTVHAATSMVGICHEQLIELLEPTDWKINDEYQFENKVTSEKVDFDSVKVYDSGEDYYFLEDTNVMQFTGLTDKSGVEIYDGDIVKERIVTFDKMTNLRESGYMDVNYEVRWGKWCYCLFLHDKFISCLDTAKANGIERIGNIYQNPELLKEKE